MLDAHISCDEKNYCKTSYFYTDIPAQIEVILTVFVAPGLTTQTSINLDASDTIAGVKLKIEAETNILASQQTLLFNGVVLSDDETVLEICIEDGSNLIVVFG